MVRWVFTLALELIAGSFLGRLGWMILGPLGGLLGFYAGYALIREMLSRFPGGSYKSEETHDSGRTSYGSNGGWQYWTWTSYDNAGSYRRSGDFGFPGTRMDDISKSYAALGIEPTATDDEVKKAYRDMAIKYHPDKYAGRSASEQKAAEEKFKIIGGAYERIKKQRNL